MQQIYVDLQGLGQVHRTIRTIYYDLERFDSGYAASRSGAMGHHRVIAAFEDYVHGWTDGRERILDQLEVAAAQIEGAVEAYTQTEDSVTDMSQTMLGGFQ